MIDRFYLDESGNSGDAALPGTCFDFGGQRFFSLACIGCGDIVSLEAELARLAVKHRIKANEFKSTALTKKPQVAADIAAFLEAERLPLFVEVMDKRFFIAIHMINHLIMPVVGEGDFSPEGQWIRNIFAEYLDQGAPANVFEVFVAACNAPSNVSVAASFRAVQLWLKQQSGDDEVGLGLLHFAEDSLQDFLREAADNSEAFARYLPLPDQGTSGKKVWMLPSLTALTNIYARINLYTGGAMSGVTLIHDEQDHFETILREAKATVERLGKAGDVPMVRFADYRMVEGAALDFGHSHEHAGIQAADVLAGFVMRYVRNALAGKTPSGHGAREVFQAIVGLSDPPRGIGVNFVMPTRDVLRLGVLPA